MARERDSYYWEKRILPEHADVNGAPEYHVARSSDGAVVASMYFEGTARFTAQQWTRYGRPVGLEAEQRHH